MENTPQIPQSIPPQTSGRINRKITKIIVIFLLLVITAVVALMLFEKKPVIQPENITPEIKTEPAPAPVQKPAKTETNIKTPTPNLVPNGEEAVESDIVPNTENTPRQSGFLDERNLPDDIIKINVGNSSFSPTTFTTKANAQTSFSLTGTDSYTHLIAFDDPMLSSITVLVGPGQTKAITFQAPGTPGEYSFSCASPGHSDKGEVGKMIVQ